MSIDLILEVMDHAPAELTTGERLVLVIVAERANDRTRIAMQSKNWTLDTIARRAGVGRDGLRRIFQRLAKNGCEVRKKLGTDSRGNPVFAFEGTAMTFQVPHLARGDGSTTSEVKRRDAGTASEVREVVPQSARGGTAVPQRGDGSTTQTLMTLKEPSTPSPLPPVVSDAPSSASTGEEGEGAESLNQTTNPHQEQAGRLTAPYADRIRNGQRADLELLLAAALDRGWAPNDLERELGARHNGLNDLGAGLIARIRTLRQPPAPRALEPAAVDDERCPIPGHRDPARNCGICWGSVKAGQDPFVRHEDLRPAWWHEVYRRPTRRPRQETMNR